MHNDRYRSSRIVVPGSVRLIRYGWDDTTGDLKITVSAEGVIIGCRVAGVLLERMFAQTRNGESGDATDIDDHLETLLSRIAGKINSRRYEPDGSISLGMDDISASKE